MGKRTNQKATTAEKTPASANSTALVFSREHFLPALFILLYAGVEFIPSGGSGEVMGSQWLYLSVLNIFTLGYIFIRNQYSSGKINFLFRNPVVLLYTGFVLLAGASYFIAANKIEMLVSYGRLIVTAIMMFNLFLLFAGRFAIVWPLAIVLSVFALFQSSDILLTFFKKIGDTDISRLILGLTGNAGNKNILSVSLVLKVPFIFYCIYRSGVAGRVIFSAVLFVTAFAIFLINARSAYFGLILATITFIAAMIIIHASTKNLRSVYTPVLFTIIPLILALFWSQSTIKNAIKEQGATTAYGTVFERLNTVSFTTEGSSNRLQMWTSAVDYIKKHPVMGSGYGNWKLASIPYERTYVDEIRITKHTHNDFLEMAAELGLPGGLLYILVFAVLAFLLFRAFFKTGEKADRISATTLLALLGIYFIDASLNFPQERPVTQFFFALILALTLAFIYHTKYKQEKRTANFTNPKGNLLLTLLLLFSLGAAFTTYSTFRSLKAQVKVNDDIMQASQTTKWDDIKDIFPALPNLNSYGFPISHIKAFYLVNEKKYDAALQLINNNRHVNPHLTLTEYLKAKIFTALNNQDSAFYYAKKAFQDKPRAFSHYQMLNDISLARNDSNTIDQSFREYIKYRNEARAWDRYIELKATLNSADPNITKLIDSALVYFPQDQNLLVKKASVSGIPGGSTLSASAETEYQQNFARGFELFSQQKYNEAISYFAKASSLKPTDYLAVENIGLCYYSATDYKNAITYFDKVLQNYNPTDGKSEFLKGISLLNLGNNPDGCVFLKRSMAKGFPQAAQQVSTYCK